MKFQSLSEIEQLLSDHHELAPEEVKIVNELFGQTLTKSTISDFVFSAGMFSNLEEAFI